MPAFHLDKVAGEAALWEDSNYLSTNSNLRQFRCLHPKMGPNKVGNIVTPPCLWTTSGPLSRGCSR